MRTVWSIDDEQIKIVAMGDAFRGRLDSCYDKTARKHADRLDVPEERKFAGLDAYQKIALEALEKRNAQWRTCSAHWVFEFQKERQAHL